MKLLFITTFSILILGNVLSQNFDERLLERYTDVELQEMHKSDPNQVALLEYALDNACYITAIPEGKVQDLSEITLNSVSELNFIALGLNIENANQYFRIKGENKMLVVKSTWVLNNELNNKK